MTTITLELVPNDDERITCIFCRSENVCEYGIVVRRHGERALVGIHAACVAPLKRRNDVTEERGRCINRRATIGARLVRLREDARLRRLLPHDSALKSMQAEIETLEREFAELRALERRAVRR